MWKQIALCSLLCLAACNGGSSKGRTSGPDGGISVAIDTSTASLPPSVEQACAAAATAPCGGSLVGTWKLNGICTRGMTEQQVIDKYADRFSPSSGPCGVSADVPITGYVKFRGDGTFQIDEIDGVTLGFSESCLVGIGQSCDSVRRGGAMDASVGVEKSCQSSDGICTCSVVDLPDPHAGSYATSGTAYQLYDDTGDGAGKRDYCVQGNTLSVFAPSETIGGGGIAIAVRIDDGSVSDIDASVVFPKFDAAAADAKADVSADKPQADIAADQSAADFPADSASRDAGIDARADLPKADAAVDSPQIDSASSIDAATVDAQPIDATPLPLNALAPSTAAACQLAAASPCGGDLTGSWTIAGTCDPWLSETELISQINASCNTQADCTETGPAVFNADGTCALDQKTIYKTDYPVSCLAKSNDTCSAKDQRFKNAIGTKDVVAASCILVSTDTCRCEDDFHTSGSSCAYSASGNELTFVSPPDAFEMGAFDYCVQGNALSIFVAPTSATGLACDTCTAAYVLTRQK